MIMAIILASFLFNLFEWEEGDGFLDFLDNWFTGALIVLIVLMWLFFIDIGRTSYPKELKKS